MKNFVTVTDNELIDVNGGITWEIVVIVCAAAIVVPFVIGVIQGIAENS